MPTIETQYLVLRPFLPDDADTYFTQILGDAAVMKTLSTRQPVPYDSMADILARRQRHWDEFGYGMFAVTIKENGILIGHCGLFFMPDVQETEIAYAIGKSYWGFGLGTEAARAVLRFGFETVQLARIIAVAFPDNTASLRVMEKIGLKYEKHLRVYGGEMPCYTLHRHEYQPDESFYVLHS